MDQTGPHMFTNLQLICQISKFGLKSLVPFGLSGNLFYLLRNIPTAVIIACKWRVCEFVMYAWFIGMN